MKAEHVYRPVDDPAYVVITTTVWTNPEASPAPAGSPRTALLQSMA